MNTTTVIITHAFMAIGVAITLKKLYDKAEPLVKRLLSRQNNKKSDNDLMLVGIGQLVDSHDRSHRLVVSELNHIKGQLQDIGQKVQAKQQDANGDIYIQALASLAQASNAIIERQEKIEKLLTKVLTSE